MTRTEQNEFSKNLTQSVAAEIHDKIARGIIPENWDGIELRLLLADKFAHEVCPPGKARLKDYKNTIATTTI